MRTTHRPFTLLAAAVIGWALLGSCQDDDSLRDATGKTRLHFVTGARRFHDVTRALPAGYVSYEALYPQVNIDHVKIQGYITQGSEIEEEGTFVFHEDSDEESGTTRFEWNSTIPTVSAGDYYVYGFMPAEDAGRVSMRPYTDNELTTPDYANGAVLTINNLNAVTPADVCVVVGVKGATDNTVPIEDVGIELGKFAYSCDANDNDSYIYLLLDHLYAGLHFRFRIDPTYNQLRTIKIKSLSLKADEGNQTIATVKATVVVRPNDGTASPLSVTFEPEITTNDVTPVALYLGDEKELTETSQEFLACFAPATNQKFELESHYNVYDKQGHLLREDCVAHNTIELTRVMQQGQVHTLDVTVQPTYLYMLSEPDLESPTLSIAN